VPDEARQPSILLFCKREMVPIHTKHFALKDERKEKETMPFCSCAERHFYYQKNIPTILG
jgi:hypothetical protein